MRRVTFAGFAFTILALGFVAPAAAQSPPQLEGEWITMVSKARTTPPTTSDIFLMRPDGSELVNLTNGTALDSDPELSPDGTAIAFTSYSADGGPTHVWLMDVDGANRRFVGVAGGFSPSWTPDGRSIVYSDHSGLRIVERSGAADTGIVTLPGTSPSVVNPSVSPDGSTILFEARDSNEDRQIFVVPIDGGQAVQVTTGTGFEPTWSPDGSRILFASFREGPDGNFWEINPDGSDLQHAFESRTNDFHPSWSPDGTRVVYEAVGFVFSIAVYDTATQTSADIIAVADDQPAVYRDPTWTSVTLPSVCEADPVACVPVPPGDADSDGVPGTTATTTTAAVVSPGSDSGTSTSVVATTTTTSSSDTGLIVLLVTVLLALALSIGIAIGRGRIRNEPPPPPPPRAT